MKKIFLFGSVLMTMAAVAAEKAPVERMAVFPDETVFTVRKAEIPSGSEDLKIFDDTQFFKGSFSLWSKDVDFAVKQLPRKRFNSYIYGNLNNAFANQHVVVVMKNYSNTERIVSGKLLKIENPENQYENPSVIAVEDNVSKKVTYIRVNDIESITADKADFMNDIYSAPCWIFSRKNNRQTLPFEFSYLTNGIAWQSAIELHLISKDKMNIIHNAVLRNKGKKFDCPDFYLVSGSPEIASKNIISLLCSNVTPPIQSYKARAKRSFAMASNRSAMLDSINTDAGTFISQAGDVLYRSLGKISMDKNESRLIKLQSTSNVPYRTVVQWDIPAQRSTHGKTVNNNSGQTAFNTLIFKNLCPSMLDSAPVAIYADNKLMMQSMLSSSTPVNAERRIKLSDAQDIECKIEENELIKSRVQNVIFNNRRYVRCTVETTLKVSNFRKIAAPIIIDYNFNGEFVKCRGAEYKIMHHVNGSSILNPSGNLNFEINLAPAESREIKITYTILTNI